MIYKSKSSSSFMSLYFTVAANDVAKDDAPRLNFMVINLSTQP